MSITLIIIIIISTVSILSFNNRDMFAKLQFNAYQTYHRKEYYRLISHGFVHADWVHLLVNMFVFWSFGTHVERYFSRLENADLMHVATGWYLFLFFGAIVFSSLTTLKKHRDNFGYNSVGASGGVSAITFCSIFFDPYNMVYLYFIPIPGIVFGALYLIYSYYMNKRNMDNINHEAHLMGAIFGFLFPLLINPNFLFGFINKLFLIK